MKGLRPMSDNRRVRKAQAKALTKLSKESTQVVRAMVDRDLLSEGVTVFPRYSRHALRGSGGEFLGWED